MRQVFVGQGFSALVLDSLTGTEKHRFVLRVPTKVHTVSAVECARSGLNGASRGPVTDTRSPPLRMGVFSRSHRVGQIKSTIVVIVAATLAVVALPTLTSTRSSSSTASTTSSSVSWPMAASNPPAGSRLSSAIADPQGGKSIGLYFFSTAAQGFQGAGADR